MSLWIKICGLKTAAAIEAAAEAGAQAVGFVFYERSPRNLDLATAAQLQSAVPSGLERVAVFLNPSQALLDSVIGAIAPDWIQTDIRDLAKLRLAGHQKVLPVMRTGQAFPDAFPPRLLLESARSGAGETADWQVAASVSRRTQVILAGGLTAGNVQAAVRAVRPYGVDVSSGVESSPGLKDHQRIHEFVLAARAADAA